LRGDIGGDGSIVDTSGRGKGIVIDLNKDESAWWVGCGIRDGKDAAGGRGCSHAFWKDGEPGILVSFGIQLGKENSFGTCLSCRVRKVLVG
jgi:hypothetical protein